MNPAMPGCLDVTRLRVLVSLSLSLTALYKLLSVIDAGAGSSKPVR